MPAADVPFRILPELTARNRHFWTGGGRGELTFLRCNACAKWIHPPIPICPECHSKDLAPRAVSGRATVHTYSINHQPWMPGPAVPFVVAIVEIEEDPSVRLTTNIVGCRPEDVRIGMPVRVTFEHHADPQGDVWLPLFEPDPGRRG
jgi:uncharacterized OB-fold protein